jgi:hypothetical protein
VEIKTFLGLRNTVAPENIPPGGLDVARDVDIDDAGAVRTRTGLTEVSATAAHSLWAKGDVGLVVQGQDLKRFDGSTFVQLRRLTSAAPVSYAELNGIVYYSNGVDTGRIVAGESKEWGVRNPVGQPQAAATWGSMPPGKYMYAVTFLRADGLESGTPLPAVIELAETGGIAFSGLPASSDPDVVALAMYVSSPNGQELFRAGVDMTSEHAVPFGVALDPDLIEPAPAGTVVEIHAGAVFVAQGSVVWVSDQHSLERFRRRTRFIPMPGPVTLLGAVTDGMYLATDKETWYLAGNDLSGLKAVKVMDVGATPGTMARFDAADQSGDEEAPANAVRGLLWHGPEGDIMALPGGIVRNLTEGDYSFQGGIRGAGLVRSARGYTSFVTTIRGAGNAPNAY